MAPAKPSDWKRIEDVFLCAAELSGTARGRYLDQVCAGEDGLRAEVEALLAAEAEGKGLLTDAIHAAAVTMGDDDLSGHQLGPWKLERVIGEGGMGSVYLGTRADGQFEMRVAVKILRRGMESVRLLARFRHERQILAQLKHPGIAPLLDGGSTPDGRPFLVMEFVDGQPLDAWCRSQRLSVTDRCRLFTRICDAVSYAHRNLVVHRDLKPSNILVGADGNPRLLDFGIAKLLSTEGSGGGTLTSVSERALTPDYASPEQILGLSVTTSSDVYSLGAVLFQLLAGTKPHRLETYTPDEIRRVATEPLTERPSAAALRDSDAASRAREIAGDLDNIVLMAMRKEPERRYASVDDLRQDIERYLDGRPVAARVDTFGYRAGKFLRRHRVGVAAAAVVLLSIISGGIVALHEAGVAARQRDIAQRERDAARRAQANSEREHGIAEQQRDLAQAHLVEAGTQREKAEKRLGDLVELANRTLLNIHDQLERIPGATGPRKAVVGTTLEYLDTLVSGAVADRELALAVASGYIKMGDILGSPLTPNLGDTPGAEKSYEKALAVLAPLQGGFPVTLRRFTALAHLGSLHQEAGKIADAEKFYKRALAEAGRVPAARREDEVYLHETANLYLEYSSLEAKLSDKVGIADAERAVTIRERLMARYPAKEEYAQALSADYGNLSLLLMTAGRRVEARAITAKTIAAREQNSAKHPDDVLLKRDLMMGYGRMGDLTGGPFFARFGGDDELAYSYYKKAVDLAAWLVKADKDNQLAGADYATAMMRAGTVLPSRDGVPASIDYLTRAAASFEETLKKTPRVRFVRANLGLSNEFLARRYEVTGKIPEALTHARQALAVASAMVKDEPDYASARINAMRSWDVLVHILANAGDRSALAEAKKSLDTALDYAAHGPKPERMMLFPPEARTWLGDAYAALATKPGGTEKDWEEARKIYSQSRTDWEKLLVSVPNEAPMRVADLEKKITACDGALRTAAN